MWYTVKSLLQSYSWMRFLYPWERHHFWQLSKRLFLHLDFASIFDWQATDFIIISFQVAFSPFERVSYYRDMHQNGVHESLWQGSNRQIQFLLPITRSSLKGSIPYSRDSSERNLQIVVAVAPHSEYLFKKWSEGTQQIQNQHNDSLELALERYVGWDA